MIRLSLTAKVLSMASLSLLTSCATVLNNRHQEVEVNAKGDSVSVYLDGDRKGSGNKTKISLQKTRVPHELKVQAEGFKPEYKLLLQDKRSWLQTLSIVPFGPTLIAPFVDFFRPGPKALNFKEKYNLKYEQLPFDDRKPDQKYLHLQNLTINLSDKDLRFGYNYGYENFKFNNVRTFDVTDLNYSSRYGAGNYAARKAARIEPPAKQLRSAYKGDTVERALKQHNYYDTDGLLPARLNTVFLEAELNKLTFITCVLEWFPVPIKLTLSEPPSATTATKGLATVSLSLNNYYGRTLVDKELNVQTGGFTMGRHKNNLDELVGLIFKDAMYTSVAKFMNKKAVKEHLQREKQASPEYKGLVVKSGDSVNSLQEAKEATLTVKRGKQQHGSGFVVGRKGYIITNYSVVASQSKDSNNLQVFLGKGQKVKAEVIRKNAYMDLALIKVDQKFAKTFMIPSKNGTGRASITYAIGTPGSIELGKTITKGIISGVRNFKGNTYLQSDVSVNPGSNGGPLVKENGHLIGMVSGKLTGIATEGISFSLQAHLLDDHLGINYKAN